MEKFFMAHLLLFTCFMFRSMAAPAEVEKSTGDDLSASETYGYGYYHPGAYSAPLVATGVPLPATAGFGPAPNGYGRSDYGYGSGYQYGRGYDFGKRWGHGGGGAVNEFYRRHPVYVAWG